MNNYFLNKELKDLYAPNLTGISHLCISENEILNNIYIPKVKIIEDSFLLKNQSSIIIYAPEVETIGDYFLYYNKKTRQENENKEIIISNNKCLKLKRQ